MDPALGAEGKYKMKTKWKQFGDVQSEKEYLAVASNLRLKNFWNTPRFMRFGMAIQKQLANTKGLLGYLMIMEPFNKRYGTLSVWENEDFLGRFTKESPHSEAMEDMKSCLDGPALYASWKLQGREVPPTWEDSLKKLPNE